MKESERVGFLKNDFDRQPCAKANFMSLDELSSESATVSMEVMVRHCVVDGDGRRVVQGGVIATLVDFAGVYLARFFSDSPERITPLFKLEEVYYSPVVLGKDKLLVAKAFNPRVNESGIDIFVTVEGEDEDGRRYTRGQANLRFAKRFSSTKQTKTRP